MGHPEHRASHIKGTAAVSVLVLNGEVVFLLQHDGLPAGIGLELVSRDSHLLAQAVCSGGSPEGWRKLPGAAVFSGDVHPDHTGIFASSQTL